MTIWLPGMRSTFDASVAISGFMLLGYFLSEENLSASSIPSMLLPLVLLWAFSYLVIKYKRTQEKLLHSNEHLNAMFKFATEGLIISNQKGLIVMANPRAANLFGYEQDEMLGIGIDSLVPRRFSASHAGHRKHYYKEQRNRPMGKGMTLFARRKDDSEFPVEISLSSFQIDDQLYVISFIIDITERKKNEDLIRQINEQLELRVVSRTKELEAANVSLAQANINLKSEMEERSQIEEALRVSERLYSAMARNFPDGIICVLDRNLNILFLDGRELHHLNWKRDELLNIPFESLPFWTDSNAILTKLRRVFNWESQSHDFSYDSSHYNLNAVPLPDLKGFVKEILVVIQNVTDIKKAEAEILASLEKEKKLNEMKSRFVSTASHEFRTPLSTILSSVSLIEKYLATGDEEKRNKHIERIKYSVKNLTEILNDFLSLEKLEAGKIEVHYSRFNLISFCDELREEFQNLSKNGQQIIHHHSGKSELIYSDKQLLRNICINLLNNAIKYSPEHSVIEFNSEIGDNFATILIRDYGIGIPAEDQAHLFERFFRAGNVTAIQGTGLGLNIINRYAKLLNGKISFTSEINKGSTFKLELPLETNQ